MEPFIPSSVVLVTGANGHLAQHVVAQLLALPESQRPRVRATVRSESSAAGLKSFFASQISSGALEIAYVSDIASPGSFDEAVKGVTHVAHIASPFVVGAEEAERDVIKPAIGGTTSLLRSALNVPTLQSVVITSSFAAVFDAMYGLRPGYTYGPKDWNPIDYKTAVDPKLDLSAWPEPFGVFITYLASKKLAEEAAWEVYDEAKPSWRLSTVNPAYIGGPNILPLVKGADSLSFSQKLIWSISQSKPEDKLPEVDFPGWNDVRDVAKVHILALQTPEADRQRFVLAVNLVTYSRMADVIRKNLSLNVSEQKQSLDCYTVDHSNSESILGVKSWVPFDDIVLDTIRQLLD